MMMKRTLTVRAALRALAVLLLVCLLAPQFAACKPSRGDPAGTETATQTDGQTANQEEVTQPMNEIPEKLALTSAAGFAASGNTLRMNLVGENPTLDLSNRFGVVFGAKWCLTSDEAGETELTEKVVSLSEGENVFYVKVSFRGDNFVYKAIVNYHFAYTVEFYSNSSSGIAAQEIDKGGKVVPPVNPTREGYAFSGWYLNGERFDFSAPVSGSCTLIAHWEKTDNHFYSSDTLGTGAVVFSGVNAGLHVVWKDYADAAAQRPEEVTCVLTQTYGSTQNTYEILLREDSVMWKDSDHAPSSYQLTQGAGGDWTMSLKSLPEKVDSQPCSYTLAQKPLENGYTTIQSGTAAINTLRGYVPSVDTTAKLTTRNSRLYDAAGNMIVFQGVVTYNIGHANLDKNTTPAALQKLVAIGCNAIRVSAQLIGNEGKGNGYVWYTNGSARTYAYSDANGDKRTTQADKQKMLKQIDEVIARATDAGLYIVIDWAILTSNPYQYVNEACEFFGILAEKHADNPYVLFEICNEPGNAKWSGEGGIKAYTEKVIDTVRQKGSDAVIIAAPRGSAYYISLGSAGANAGDDPIRDPLDDDRRYNVAYTFHNYAYENAYASFSWRLRDAYDAGLAVVTTEMSPMDPTFDHRDTLGYDMQQMALYVRLYQEWDVSYFYFRYGSIATAYNEWFMFRPNVDPNVRNWGRDDLSECGKWYYDLVTGNGVFITGLDYSAKQIKTVRDTFKTTHSAYGLASNSDFSVFPTFAVSGVKQGNAYFFKINSYDSLTDLQYAGYCNLIWKRISEVCTAGSAKTPSGATFIAAYVPEEKTAPMELSYQYNGTTCSLRISYGQSASDQSWGILLNIQ